MNTPVKKLKEEFTLQLTATDGRTGQLQNDYSNSLNMILVGVAAFHSFNPMLVFGFLILNDDKLINAFTWVPFKK